MCFRSLLSGRAYRDRGVTERDFGGQQQTAGRVRRAQDGPSERN